MGHNEKINYVEFPARDLDATKAFFADVFGWSFNDFGNDYTAFANQGLNGGFYRSNLVSLADKGAALIVFYSQALEKVALEVEQAGGIIVKPIFAFPGGRRFQFTEPSGNEFAVWSDR